MSEKVTVVNTIKIEDMLFSADASELRIPPGCFPVSLDTTLGNGEPFIYTSTLHTPAGDAVRYRQSLGCLDLVVFND